MTQAVHDRKYCPTCILAPGLEGQEQVTNVVDYLQNDPDGPYRKVYIAGPMRGYPEFNFPAFLDAEGFLADNLLYVSENGEEFFSPAQHDIGNGFAWEGKSGTEDEGVDLRAMLGADLAWIAANAEVILLLPGWEKSSGVAAELALAKALHLGAVVYYPDVPALSLVYEDCNSIQQKPLAPKVTVNPEDPLKVSVVTGYGVQQGEVRIVDPVTGGEKGSKPERFDLIPVGALREIARVYGFGAAKYADNNWRKGYAWHLSYAANQRHLTSFWDGEDLDPESKLPHLAHAAWQSITLLQFYLDGLGTDDRFKR